MLLNCFSRSPTRWATVLTQHRAFKAFTSANAGETIYVGETAEENDELVTRSDARDVWFHLDGHPSPHAVLKVVP